MSKSSKRSRSRASRRSSPKPRTLPPGPELPAPSTNAPAGVETRIQPACASLRLLRRFPEVQAANALIERVRRRDTKARAELVDRVRNKFGPDEELTAVCDLAAGKFKYDARFKAKDETARLHSDIANFVFEQKQLGARDPIKQAMKKFKKARRTIKYATAKYPIERALKS
jgi:hypothetical protein